MDKRAKFCPFRTNSADFYLFFTSLSLSLSLSLCPHGKRRRVDGEEMSLAKKGDPSRKSTLPPFPSGLDHQTSHPHVHPPDRPPPTCWHSMQVHLSKELPAYLPVNSLTCMPASVRGFRYGWNDPTCRNRSVGTSCQSGPI